MNGPIAKTSRYRCPLLNLRGHLGDNFAGNSKPAGSNAKPFVVFVHGETWCGDPIARDKGSYATYGEAHVECAAWAKLHGEAWIEKHSGCHRADVLGGWKRTAVGVVEDATVGPRGSEL